MAEVYLSSTWYNIIWLMLCNSMSATPGPCNFLCYLQHYPAATINNSFERASRVKKEQEATESHRHQPLTTCKHVFGATYPKLELEKSTVLEIRVGNFYCTRNLSWKFLLYSELDLEISTVLGIRVGKPYSELDLEISCRRSVNKLFTRTDQTYRSENTEPERHATATPLPPLPPVHAETDVINRGACSHLSTPGQTEKTVIACGTF